MKLNIKPDLVNCYDIEKLADDFSYTRFTTETEQGNVNLYISIENNKNRLLSDVYNVAFGPLNEDGIIDDMAILKHIDNSKVYSTIIFAVRVFLEANKGVYAGIDGSDLRRAYLYFKIIQSNYDYLAQYFNVYGVKYYIRLLRGINNRVPSGLDHEDLSAVPTLITKGLCIHHSKVFNYFIFNSAN